MKLHHPKVSRKLAIVSGVIVLSVVGGVSAEMVNKPKVGADTSPIVTEVDQQNDKLANHEARITNLEGDTKALQDRTGGSPAVNRVDVPTVRDVTSQASSQTSSAASPSLDTTTAPAVVTGYREIVIDADNSDCEYTYSDGTTHQFKWKVTNPQGAWVTDGVGNNGHWIPSTSHNGACDSTAIGRTR